jgi:hypothetical protein
LTSRRRKRADFHPSDQTSLDGETMPDVFIGQPGSHQVAHDLMHFHQDTPGNLLVEGDRLHIGG